MHPPRPTAAGTRGRKKGAGRSCHMQMTVCEGLFSFSFSGNPGALLPVPLSHRLPIVPALWTAGDSGPGAGRPLLTRRASRPTAGSPGARSGPLQGNTPMAPPAGPGGACTAPLPPVHPPRPHTCPAPRASLSLLSWKPRSRTPGQGSREGPATDVSPVPAKCSPVSKSV